MTRTLIKCTPIKNITNRKWEAQRNLHDHEDVKFPNVSEVGIRNPGGWMSEGQDPHLVRRKCGNHLKIILFSSPVFPLLTIMYLTLMLTEGHSVIYVLCIISPFLLSSAGTRNLVLPSVSTGNPITAGISWFVWNLLEVQESQAEELWRCHRKALGTDTGNRFLS